MFGLLAKGLRQPSRRRRKAFRFLAWWALGSVVVVALAILVLG
jgi:hypothetical protein